MIFIKKNRALREPNTIGENGATAKPKLVPYPKRSTIARTFVCFELIIWSVLYYCGDQGIRQIQQMKATNAQVQKHVVALQSDIAIYQHELDQWNTFAFYKEKIARERLQMARSTDMVFYLTDNRQAKYSKTLD